MFVSEYCLKLYIRYVCLGLSGCCGSAASGGIRSIRPVKQECCYAYAVSGLDPIVLRHPRTVYLDEFFPQRLLVSGAGRILENCLQYPADTPSVVIRSGRKAAEFHTSIIVQKKSLFY